MFSDKGILFDWKYVEKAYAVQDRKFLRYFCETLHQLAGWGTVKVNGRFEMDQAFLLYKNPMFFPSDVNYLQYVIQEPQTFEGNVTMTHFYITQGLKEDCIFYLIPTNYQKLDAFNVGHHVCGVHYALKGIPSTSEPPATFVRGKG